MMQSLDTNVVLRLIVGDIPAQRQRATQLIEGTTGQFGVADVVFIEVEYALRQNYGMSRSQIANLLGAFTAHPRINCNRPLLRQILKKYEAHPALSFTDICVTSYAHLNDATPLWTFDKKLARQLKGAQLVN